MKLEKPVDRNSVPYPDEVMDQFRKEGVDQIEWNRLVTINRARMQVGSSWRTLDSISQEALLAREILLAILEHRGRELDSLKDRIRHTMIHADIEGWGLRPGEELLPLEAKETLGQSRFREARR